MNMKKNKNNTPILLVSFLFIVLCSITSSNAQDIKYERQLKEGWSIESSEKASTTGDKISQIGFDATKWYKTTVPSTVMAALIANNEYQDIFMGENINKVDTTRFRVPWWYRNEFEIDDPTKNIELVFEGN